MAARDSRKREMIAKLNDDTYVSALVDEAYTIIFHHKSWEIRSAL